MFQIIRPLMFILLAVTSLIAPAFAVDVSIPDPQLNAAIRFTLNKPNGPLTDQDLLGLTGLSASFRTITNLQGLEAAHNLGALELEACHLTNAAPLGGLTNLSSLNVSDNQLTSVKLATNLMVLGFLNVSANPLTNLTLPNQLPNLGTLRVEFGALSNLTLPPGMKQLSELRLGFNRLTNLVLRADMTNLSVLSAFANDFTNFTVPPSLTNLTQIDLSDNALGSLELPPGLTKLTFLALGGNHLTRFTIPAGMTNLTFLRLNDNLLTNLTLPSEVNHLSLLDLSVNQLTNLTLPPELTNLTTLSLGANPLTTFVLSEPMTATTLAPVVAALQNQGVAIFTYPLKVGLLKPQQNVEKNFEFTIAGPPGVYTILSSANLTTWSDFTVLTNQIGSVLFSDATAKFAPQKFYRVRKQGPPANMVFIPPSTFKLGSPSNEFDREIFEGPQATVTLTRGFWIGKFEVTQGEYLAVTGENPSDFPGDLTRAISSVSWFDATNYCWKLTQRELAAGRIPAGSQYRLPTEAEWECATRAGTTTRFSFGDDLTYASVTNYAWFLDLGHPDLIVHPVGQKLPNPWGLYDVHGNVWEWCQDWYSDQQGGVLTDPTGPASSPNGTKVIRGGAYDYPNSSCRSASRFFRFPLMPDSDVGFRVVLVTGP